LEDAESDPAQITARLKIFGEAVFVLGRNASPAKFLIESEADQALHSRGNTP